MTKYYRQATTPRQMAWRSRFGLMVALVCLLLSGSVQAEDYLSAGEIAAVSGGSIALMGLRGVVNRFDSTRQPLISGPLPGEETIQRWLGGDPKPGKRNFLDDKAGSIVTPLTLAVALTAIDLSWPRQDKGKETAQDLFLYISGLVAVKGVTGVAKGLVARRRPILHFAPELAPHTNEGEWRHHRQSFFSGHTSSSFFAAAYLNLRMRTIMRAELSPMDYRSWRWAPPTLLFGWSSFVGLSRIHAYRHYLSDVLAGALVGTIMAELFFALNDSPSISDDDGNASSTPMLLRMRYRF